MESALPFVVMLLAVLFRRRLAAMIIGIFPLLDRLAAQSVYGKWQGKYYSYENHQIRLCLVDETVWVVEKDILPLLEPAPSQRELQLLGNERAPVPVQKNLMAISETGLMRLLELRTNHRRTLPAMIKLKSWLQKEALPNVQRLPSSSIQ